MAIKTHQSKSPFTYVLNTVIIKEHIHKFITLQVKLKVRCTCLCLIFNLKIPIEIYFLSPKPLKSVLFYCSNDIEQCFKRLYKNSPRQILPKVISLLVNSYRVNSHLTKFLFHEFPPGEFTSSYIPLRKFLPWNILLGKKWIGKQTHRNDQLLQWRFAFANGIFLTSLRLLIAANYPM